MTSVKWRTFQLRELHGPSLFTAEAGWLLELIPEASCQEAWKQLQRRSPAGILSLIPNLTFRTPVSPTQLCLQLAAQLITPVAIRVVPTAVHLQVSSDQVLAVQSGWHELCGDALKCSLMLLRLAERPPMSIGPAERRIALAAYDQIRSRAAQLTSHAFSNAVVDCVSRRHLPFTVMDASFAYGVPLFQLGIGSRGRLVSSTSIDGDSMIGGHICQNKEKLNSFLSALGFPVPRQIFLAKGCSQKQQITAARSIGYPCVVKPCDSGQGLGVTVNIADDDALLSAIENASSFTKKGFVVEQHVPGHYHRLVVVNHQLLRVLRLDPPHLIGDGRRTIADILDLQPVESNCSGAVITGAASPPRLTAAVLACLAQQGLTPEDVAPSGERVVLQLDLADRSDWVYRECLSGIDPSLERFAIDLSHAVSMSNVGIDLLSPDILKPIYGGEFWIVEINPVQRLHPAWAEKAIDIVFPDNQSARIPVQVCVTTRAGLWSELRQLCEGLDPFSDYTIALPVRLKAEFLDGPCGQLAAGRRLVFYGHPREVLFNRSIAALLFLIDWPQLLQSGLPTPWVDQLHLVGSLQPIQQQHWQLVLEGLKSGKDVDEAVVVNSS
jgi:cyanophycin synthetase